MAERPSRLQLARLHAGRFVERRQLPSRQEVDLVAREGVEPVDVDGAGNVSAALRARLLARVLEGAPGVHELRLHDNDALRRYCYYAIRTWYCTKNAFSLFSVTQEGVS